MSDESTNQPDQQPEIQDDHSLIGKEGYFKSFKYGAPELQRLYNKYFSRGLIIAISIYLLLIGGYVLAMYIQKVNADEKDKYNNIITLEDLDLPPSAEEEPPPPDVEIPDEIIPLKDLEALIPEPVPKQEAEILTMKTQEKLEEINAPVSSEGDENAPNINYIGDINLNKKKVEEKVEKKEEKKKDVYQQFEVEVAPKPVNLGSVRGSMRYPEIARSSGTEGRVTAKILVGADGSVIKVGSLSGPSVFHDEVRDKVGALQFTPALQNGKPVKCWVSVPFNFKLNSGFKKKDDEEEDSGNEE
ncbi:MAG: energy transducer TonB [Ignavibacteriae bacterium]|nr:energy transducer TonB [Ignavibacteriota bacterium]MCB9243258.1 energy transducer TonB [Ignavibacteriales bacterium]